MSDSTRTPLPDPATKPQEKKSTEIGSVFVSNYPPYSFWNTDDVSEAHRVLREPAKPDTPLGLYMHIPFCRKRCKFCYFKVYTGKNARDVETYLDALAREIELFGTMPAAQNRPVNFVYFGGGTPSFISVKHLQELVTRVKDVFPWDKAEEVAFECEPGTLTESKLNAIREIGVTRLSLGVEHFNDDILKENGRAHLSHEIYRVWPWVKALDFAQVNIDLIAGMVGETWDTWKFAVDEAIKFEPDSITIYQLELPFNAVYSEHIRHGEQINVADWKTKRAWHKYAIDQLSAAGYDVSSGYTMVRKSGKTQKFVYRDALWRGADMVAAGVASFSHMSGVHFQNASHWDTYLEKVGNNELPVTRAFSTNSREQLIREMILQLKLGRIPTSYFRQKFGVNILQEFSRQFSDLRANGMLDFDDQLITLSQKGLLQVDQLLPEFYDEHYRNSRYT